MTSHPNRSRKPSRQQVALLRYIADQGGALSINDGFNRRTAWALLDKGLLKTDGASAGAYAGRSFSGLTFVITEAGIKALANKATPDRKDS